MQTVQGVQVVQPTPHYSRPGCTVQPCLRPQPLRLFVPPVHRGPASPCCRVADALCRLPTDARLFVAPSRLPTEPRRGRISGARGRRVAEAGRAKAQGQRRNVEAGRLIHVKQGFRGTGSPSPSCTWNGHALPVHAKVVYFRPVAPGRGNATRTRTTGTSARGSLRAASPLPPRFARHNGVEGGGVGDPSFFFVIFRDIYLPLS